MAFLDKNGLQNLTNKLVLGENIKVESSKGTNVKNILDNIERECTNVSTPLQYNIENRVNEFRVGQGRDIDVTHDVETGYSEFNFKGRTWQNLITNTRWIINSSGTIAYMNVDWKLLKPHTQYTFIILDMGSKIRKDNVYVGVNFTQAKCEYYKPILITSNGLTSTGTKQPHLYSLDGEILTQEDMKDTTLILLEGDHTQTPIEELPTYFEGIQSSFENGTVEVENIGKNLFDGEVHAGYIVPNTGQISGETGVNVATHTNFIKVKPKTYYTKSVYGGSYCLYDINKNPIGGSWNSATTIYTEDAHYIVLTIEYMYTHMLNEIQFEEGKVSTQYTSYCKEEIITREIGQPLRSLPNGVCDEIVGDKFIQRVGKIVLDGSESDWFQENTKENTIVFRKLGSNIKSESLENNMYCNSLPINAEGDVEKIVITKDGSGTTIYIAISKSKATTVQQFKQFISNNNIVFYCELETPIITTIEPLKFKTKPCGTYKINSYIAPVSTHTIQLNRSGQIERVINEIAELKNRIDVIENMYDTTFLETQHQLSLLNMEYTLEGGTV